MKTFHCSGAFFIKIEDEWYLPGVTDLEHLDQVKLPGGMVEEGEDPEDTMVREYLEETGLKPISSNKRSGAVIEVHRSDPTDKSHQKIFYLINEVEGSLVVGEVKDIMDDGRKAKVRLWKVQEFFKSLFKNYKKGFIEIFINKSSVDETFREDNRAFLFGEVLQATM